MLSNKILAYGIDIGQFAVWKGRERDYFREKKTVPLFWKGRECIILEA